MSYEIDGKVTKIAHKQFIIEIKTSGFWKEKIPFIGKKLKASGFETLEYDRGNDYFEPYVYDDQTTAFYELAEIFKQYKERGNFTQPDPSFQN